MGDDTMRHFVFTDHTGGAQGLSVSAIDGHNAWQMLKLCRGEKQWHGGYETKWPSGWGLEICCEVCWEPSGYHFCSENCYQIARGGCQTHLRSEETTY